MKSAEQHKHTQSPTILAGFSVGGDAALRAGRSKDGKKWDLGVVAGARITSDYMGLVEAAAKNSDKLVIVGIKGDKNMAKDGFIIGSTIGSSFGDRSYEGIVDAVKGKYGTLDDFYKAFPHVSIQSSEGSHGGGGNRAATQDAIRRGVKEIEGR